MKTQKNLRFLITEIFEIETNPIPTILHNLFQFHENTLVEKFNSGLRNFREPLTHDKKTSWIRNCYRALFLRAELPSECKNSTSPSEFKTKVKN